MGSKVELVDKLAPGIGYEKMQVDSSLKQQELNLEREQKRAVAIGAT